MKQIYIILVLAFSLSTAVVAQQPREGERLEALKIAYLTKKLNITTEEAKQFWPVYNNYIDETKQARMSSRNGNELEREEKILAIRKKYQPQFSKALSPDRANQFYKAEKDFYGYVQKELMERRQQRQDNHPRRNGNDNE